MTFHDFNKMNEIDKMGEIADNAVFLMRRKDGCYKVSLYQLYGFYIEAYIDLMKLSYKFVRAFDNVNMLKEYLRKIDISGLFPYDSNRSHAK